MKITEMLEVEHAVVETLMERLRLAARRPGPHRPAEVRAMAECLGAVVERHARAEEAVFYPRLKALGAMGLLESLLTAGHADIRGAALRTAACGDGAPAGEWAARVDALLAALREHFERERRELFPLVERAFDARTLEDMGREAMAALGAAGPCVTGGQTPPPRADETALPFRWLRRMLRGLAPRARDSGS